MTINSRRQFLSRVVGVAASATLGRCAIADDSTIRGAIPPMFVVSGKPRDRGLAYGERFRDGIRHFLDKEIYSAFIKKPNPKDELLRYAASCSKVIREVCPIIHDEMTGVAAGAGISLGEIVLMSLHEELYHRGALPKVNHCTAVAVGPPETAGGKTYVGQTWDWMESVFGLSSIIEWKRNEGPSLLAYGYPGLWTGAGMNSAGIALVWTSANLGNKTLGARVGVPSYAFLTHLLYQDSLDAVEREAKRDIHAGWFTFVMGDGNGNLLNVEGSPKGIAVERAKGSLVRVGFGSHEMTGTPKDKPVKLHGRCAKMAEHFQATHGKTDLQRLKEVFADPKCGISVGKPTIDMMVFDTKERVTHLSRGPSYSVEWQEFRFSK